MSQADWLGMMIASRSCLDVLKGANALKKLSDAETAAGKTKEGWTDSHPLSIDRYKVLVGLAREIKSSSEEYNPLFDDTLCSNLSRRLFSLGRS